MNMGNVIVKNGTPVGNQHLCKSCTWCQYTTGFRESDMLVICTNTNPNVKVTFVVHQCSEYLDRNRPDWDQMEELAIEVRPARVLRATPGFSVSEVIRTVKPVDVEDEDEDSKDEEAARLRPTR